MAVFKAGLSEGASSVGSEQVISATNKQLKHLTYIQKGLLTSFIFSIVNVRNNKKHGSEGKIREYFSVGQIDCHSTWRVKKTQLTQATFRWRKGRGSEC